MGWFSRLIQLFSFSQIKRWAPSSGGTSGELTSQITAQLNEADFLIKQGVLGARSWLHWAKPIAMPWCIVLYDDYDHIKHFIHQSTKEFPIQNFSPEAFGTDEKVKVILTTQGVVIAWPMEWSHGCVQWKELCKWFGDKHRRSYVQRIVIETPIAQQSKKALMVPEWAFTQRQLITSFAAETGRFPETSLLLTSPKLSELHQYDDEANSHITGIHTNPAYTEETIRNDWLAWIKQCEHDYAKYAASYDTAQQIQLLSCIALARDSEQAVGMLVRCLAEPNAYHPPVPVIELNTVASNSKAIAFWWNHRLWPQTQSTLKTRSKTSLRQVLIHAATATCLSLGLSVWIWQCGINQYQHISRTIAAVKRAQQPGAWLLGQTLENTLALADAQKALFKATQQTPMAIAMAKSQTSQTVLNMESTVLNRLNYSFVIPNGKALDQYFSEVNAPSSKSRYAQTESNADIIYSRLKAYLMLCNQGKSDEQFLLAQLPSIWKGPLTEANSGSFSNATQEAAQRVLELYNTELSNPRLPIYKGNATLIAQTREALRSSKQSVTVADKIYSDIRAKASAQFPALTLGKIIGEPHANWFNSRSQIAGAFTKTAYEQFVQPAFIKAGKGAFDTDDWVLGNQTTIAPTQIKDSEKLVAELQALYQKEFVAQWIALVRQAEWSGLDQPKSLNEALAALSSSNSPYLILFKRIVDEASWANGSWAQAQLAKAQSLLPLSNKLISNSQPKPAHPLGEHYDVLISWISADKSIAQNYAEQIGKAQQKWTAWTQNSDQAADIRQDLSAIFQNGNSEWSEVVKFIDQQMLRDMPLTERDIFRELLMKPVIKPLTVASRIVGQDLQAIWQREVWMSWTNLSQRYPFAEEGVDAGLGDLAKFFKAKDGTLARFTEKHLGPFVTNRAGVLSPRLWNGVALDFSPGYLDALNRLSDFAVNNINEAETAQFELRPIPTPGIADIQLEIDGQALRYRNGPQSWKTFSWPNTTANRGARIQVQRNGGQTITAIQHNSRLGVLRLLSQAKTSRDGNVTNLSWPVDAQDGENTQINFQYRHVSGLDPLALRSLKRTSLPQRIIR